MKIKKHRQNRGFFFHFLEQIMYLSGQIGWENKAGHASYKNKSEKVQTLQEFAFRSNRK